LKLDTDRLGWRSGSGQKHNAKLSSDNSWIPPYGPWLFGVALIGWLIGPLLGFYFGKRSQIEAERRKAKNEFLAFIAVQRAKLDEMKWREAEFFEQSAPAFRDAVCAIRPFLPPGQWTRLHAVLQDYQSRHKSEFEGGNSRMVAAIAADLGTGRTHEQTLREFLDRFEDCVKKNS